MYNLHYFIVVFVVATTQIVNIFESLQVSGSLKPKNTVTSLLAKSLVTSALKRARSGEQWMASYC